LVAAGVILFALARHVDDVTNTEQAIFEFFNTLPGGLFSVFQTLYRLGTLWVLVLLVGATLLTGRWRLGRALLVAGALAWAAARVIGQIVVERQSFGRSLSVITRSGPTPSFPLVRLAVLVAVVSVARPYVSAPVRRVGQGLVVVMAFAALYLGRALPNDAFAAIVLGWGVAAFVHLMFGSPGGRPTAEQVHGALHDLGIDARNVRLSLDQPAGSTVVFADDDDGPLWITAIGRDELDARWLAKVVRFVVYKERGPTPSLTRLHQVQREAYFALLARDAGVRVPQLVIADAGGAGTVLLAERALSGQRLGDVEPALLSDSWLTDLWRQVRRLHAARIVHGALGPRQVVATDDGPALIDFSASQSWSREQAADDIAELLVTTATLIGIERAVASAVEIVGSDQIVGALARLQPAALSRETRSFAASRQPHLQDWLDDLRGVGADLVGIEPPPLEQLTRIKTSSVLMALGTLVAIIALLTQLGTPSEVAEVVGHADVWWFLLAFALSMLTNVPYALALMGTVPTRLPLWPTTELQIAMSFSNLAVPAVGGLGIQVRFLQKEGLDLPSAIAAGGVLNTIAAVVTQVGLLALAVTLAPNTIDLGNIQTSDILKIVLASAFMVGVVSGIALGLPKLRQWMLPALHNAATTTWQALRSPQRVMLLIGGNIAVSLLYALTLLACLHAFGGTLSFWTLLGLSIAGITLAQLVPLPGGGTAVASIGISAALIAFGVPKDVAVATALTNQLVVMYLPAVPGWFATTHMIRQNYL
jgi:undecaprenyl-diphosphatase